MTILTRTSALIVNDSILTNDSIFLQDVKHFFFFIGNSFFAYFYPNNIKFQGNDKLYYFQAGRLKYCTFLNKNESCKNNKTENSKNSNKFKTFCGLEM